MIGSKTATCEVLEEQVKSLVRKIIYHNQKVGKGVALRIGFQVAIGDIEIFQDADLEYDLWGYLLIVEPIFLGGEEGGYGMRFLNQKRKEDCKDESCTGGLWILGSKHIQKVDGI